MALTEEARSELALAVTELSTNIIRHGYRGSEGPIELTAAENNDAIEITVSDQAPVFPFEANKETGESLLREGGYGLELIAKLTDEVSHKALGDRGNRVTLIKRRKPRS